MLVSLPLTTAGVVALCSGGAMNRCWLVLSWALASLVDAFAGIASCCFMLSDVLTYALITAGGC